MRPLLVGPVVVLTHWFVLDQLGVYGHAGQLGGTWLALVLLGTTASAVLKRRYGFRHWVLDTGLNAVLGVGAIAATLASCAGLALSVAVPGRVTTFALSLTSVLWLTLAAREFRRGFREGFHTEPRTAVLALALLLPVGAASVWGAYSVSVPWVRDAPETSDR